MAKGAKKTAVKPPSKMLLDMVSKQTYEYLRIMGMDEYGIEKWQRSRIMQSLAMIPLGGVMFLITNSSRIAVVVAFLSIVWYVMTDKDVETKYRNYRFDRALAFSKFTRLIVPYLKVDANGGTESKMFNSLNSILNRLDDPEDRKILAVLLNEIAEDPNDKRPYQRYAEKMGGIGDDFALTFMETLYDIRQGATNLSIIDNLAQDSSRRIQELTNDIVARKERKLYNFLTYLIITLLLPVLGIMGAFVFDSLQFFQGF